MDRLFLTLVNSMLGAGDKMSNLEGNPAPEFACPGSDGRTHRLSDYTGQKLLIFFYPKDNTPGCTAEASGFRDACDMLHTANIAVLGVSADSMKRHHNFIAENDLNFPLLSDPEHKMLIAYQAWGKKKLYGKEYDGIIRSTVLIDEQGIVIRHWPNVTRAAPHPAKVLEWLEASGQTG